MVVDFHAYFQTQSFLDNLRRRSDYPRIEQTAQGEVIWSGPGAARRIRAEQTDIARRVELLEQAGIDTQILRLQNVSGVDALEAAEGREVARAANEEMAGIARRYPGRFIAYATVPMRDVKAAVAELEHAVTRLGHQGVGISTSVDGKPLDHPEFAPFLECVARLDVPLLILPNHPSMIDGALQPHGWLTGAFGFQVDLSVVALRLLAAGALDRHPGQASSSPIWAGCSRSSSSAWTRTGNGCTPPSGRFRCGRWRRCAVFISKPRQDIRPPSA